MRALILLIALAGCAAPQVLPPVPIPLRNPTAQVGSQADATPQRLQGAWTVVQGAGMQPGARLVISEHTLRLDGVALGFRSQGAGRYSLGDEAIWVHWLDADNRTAAMGEPGGARVWIMDRTGAPGERLNAARGILKWYGYDLNRLESQ